MIYNTESATQLKQSLTTAHINSYDKIERVKLSQTKTENLAKHWRGKSEN